MVDVATFLQKYGNKDAEEILSVPHLERDIHDISKQLDTLDEALRDEVEKTLAHISRSVEEQIQYLHGEMADKKDTIDRSQKNTDACLAYLKSGKGPGKRKN